MLTREDEMALNAIARTVHERWVEKHRPLCASRLSPHGDELMKPYDELAQRAKQYNVEMVREVLRALAELAD